VPSWLLSSYAPIGQAILGVKDRLPVRDRELGLGGARVTNWVAVLISVEFRKKPQPVSWSVIGVWIRSGNLTVKYVN
jgi:hypothetical protein